MTVYISPSHRPPSWKSALQLWLNVGDITVRKTSSTSFFSNKAFERGEEVLLHDRLSRFEVLYNEKPHSLAPYASTRVLVGSTLASTVGSTSTFLLYVRTRRIAFSRHAGRNSRRNVSLFVCGEGSPSQLLSRNRDVPLPSSVHRVVVVPAAIQRCGGVF